MLFRLGTGCAGEYIGAYRARGLKGCLVFSA